MSVHTYVSYVLELVAFLVKLERRLTCVLKAVTLCDKFTTTNKKGRKNTARDPCI